VQTNPNGDEVQMAWNQKKNGENEKKMILQE
jgi:hypothetical protein